MVACEVLNGGHVLTVRQLAAAARVFVKAGDVIGYVGAPAPDAMACLHFDLWQLDEELHYASVDPRNEMPSWLVLPWNLTPTGRFERALA